MRFPYTIITNSSKTSVQIPNAVSAISLFHTNRKIMDFFTNQWVPARRAFQPEFQYRAAAQEWRAFRPEFSYEAPERREFQYKAAPERRSVQPDFQYDTAPAPAPELRRLPKVVQIPVRFVGDEETRSASALKIQKVFRGYLVRKSVRKIIGIKWEVDAIEARVSKREVLDLIREKDGKERLKINESLMALLFKLDAVSGCGDPGIRLCRKAVIRKAIALQEKVDALANDRAPEMDEKLEVENPHDKGFKSTDSEQIHEEFMSNSVSKDDEEYEFVEQNGAAVAYVDDDELKGDTGSLMVEDEKEIGVVTEQPVGGAVGGDRDMVERVVEQNGKMMKLMEELFEKNTAQAKMLGSLAHRLEQLEKAYVCDKIDKTRRKKKKLSP